MACDEKHKLLIEAQYMAEPNSPYSRDLTTGPPPFWNVNSVGQTYGLEPNYPCCTVNHPQGYPKFLSASFVGVGDNGLGHALLSPATVSTTLRGGNKVSVGCNTNYPFGGTLVYTITADKDFDFYVRVPDWYVAGSSSISNGGKSQKLSPDPSSGMHKISIVSGQSHLIYTLGANFVIQPRSNDTVAVRYGALLFGLEIGEDVTAGPPRSANRKAYPDGSAPPQAHDYTIENTTAWNLAIDPSTLKVRIPDSFNSADIQPLPNPIYTAGAPPINMTVQACEIAWPLWRGLPDIPPKMNDRTCMGAPFEATLIPYGSAKLHMAELPTVDLKGRSTQRRDE